MSLTDVEQRSLDQIATALRRTSPRLADRMVRGSVRPRTMDVLTVVVAVVLLTSLAIGIAFQLRVLCAVDWTAAMGLAVVRGIYADDEY